MDLNTFLTHNEEVVRKAAEHVLSLREHVRTGDLSADEFEELAGDVLDLQRVDALADKITNKALVEQALIQLKAALPGLLSSVLKS